MGVCINLWTWKANGFLAPFRCQTDGLTGALLLPGPRPGPPPNPKRSIVPKREPQVHTPVSPSPVGLQLVPARHHRPVVLAPTGALAHLPVGEPAPGAARAHQPDADGVHHSLRSTPAKAGVFHHFTAVPMPFNALHAGPNSSSWPPGPFLPRGRPFLPQGLPDFPWLRNSEFVLHVWPCSPLPPPLFVFVPYMYRAESVHIQNMAHVVIIFCMNSWNSGRTDSRHSERAVECHEGVTLGKSRTNWSVNG